MTALDELLAFQRQTEALSSVAERLGWDQETVMPRGASEQRAEEMAAMEAVLHERRTDPRIGEWLDRAEPEDAEDQRILDLIAREHRRAIRIPARLATELARQTSLSQGIWAEARAKDSPDDFLPVLNDILMLKREEAAALADGGDLYDALLDDYEPGASQWEIARLFDAMRPRLVALRDEILGAEFQPQPLTGHFPQETQLRLARICATAFGYDWTRGRMDLAVHPFSSGRWQDSRITTRVVETDPFNCLYSTIHEVGHSSYELGIDSDYAFTPLGRGVSMGAHESQSRIYENQIGRSQAFTGWLYRRMCDAFGGLSVADADAFYATVNRVTPGFIRTEADEVQYNLHVMLRFDLERDLIAGRLDVDDLPEAWNNRFLKDFGVAVDRPANGVLQDVHWAVGLFGYFPTYTLGNVYAGCLHEAMREALPELDQSLAQGDAEPAVEWLRENMQRHGGLYPPRELIQRAIGGEISEEPLLNYLEQKFAAIYRL
ncbi:MULTISPECIES: carboxypeptidase M32 [unclassified Paracoccus (in: a-proteobacteria)]|uniref:carboxypeptidase M32 n=1 Tax=unclassified Paracoccus (in: a-proteobacteria) TaxID=2688777 RepID=UPI0012B3D528|nr:MULTISPECIES: carboxypeptidase M32 [unclassified Paracoccus (in: a-proteobacteria)]UXU74652.1 carboxypeptidase M32 [Paracoccus sp. SMMA_5]UXU80547.1 carboxypeptidase M32 [Paracoccus sp. SMMA_5_TC]